ncbi:DNA primase [compost metagenome]
MRKIDETILKTAVEYIQENYHIEEYLKEFNMLDGAVAGGIDTVIVICVFHGNDSHPSLRVDKKRNLYKCFACKNDPKNPSGGNLPSFIAKYKRVVKEENVTYFTVIDELLRNDPVMQLKVGAKSIFVEGSITTQEIAKSNLKKSVSFKLKDSRPKTYLELSRKIRTSCKGDENVILTSIHLMESGMEPEKIYDMLFEDGKIIKRKDYSDEDLNDLMELE